MTATFSFLVDTYRTEIEKTLSVWTMAAGGGADLLQRPRAGDRRGRNLLEHMVHQCQSEHGWFQNMLGIATAGEVLPTDETVAGFVATYAGAATARLCALESQTEPWWLENVKFFDVERSRAWVLVRRIAHSAHHRGQQTSLLRAQGIALYSTYGPTADTGGLGPDGAPVIYRHPDTTALLRGEVPDPASALPPAAERRVTERPDDAE